jgi:hypothetical protein
MPVLHEHFGYGMRRIALVNVALLSFLVGSNESPRHQAAKIQEQQALQLAPNLGSLVLSFTDLNKNVVNPPVIAPTPAEVASSEVTPLEFAEWSRVNQCEESGNWYVAGPLYSGGLGISDSNWASYGGEMFAPSANQATPDEQIVIASRIQTYPPDQDGCTSW